MRTNLGLKESPHSAFALRPSARGFTLMETLVVIGVIVILAGILFPVIGKAREQGRKTNCAANLGQIGHAMQMYATDNDQRYPDTQPGYWLAGCVVNDAAKWENSDSVADRKMALDLSWQGAILSYLKTREVLVCPSRRDFSYDNGKTGYAYNGTFWNGVQIPCPPSYIVGTKDSTSGFDGYLKITDVADTNTIMITDSTEDGKPEIDGGPTETCGKICPSKYPENEKPEARHNQGSNVLFADGHAKWKKAFLDYQWTIEQDDSSSVTCGTCP